MGPFLHIYFLKNFPLDNFVIFIRLRLLTQYKVTVQGVAQSGKESSEPGCLSKRRGRKADAGGKQKGLGRMPGVQTAEEAVSGKCAPKQYRWGINPSGGGVVKTAFLEGHTAADVLTEKAGGT